MTKTYLVSALYAEELRTLEAKITEMLSDKAAYSAFEDDDREESQAYKVLNGIALYSINGKMLTSGNWVTQLFGIPTYDQISNDLAQIAQDDSVREVLIAMDTPGGSYAGISDVSDTWRRLNASKPVTVHTAGTLASAGVWLASNSTAIYASETSDVGSIGVILQHVSQEGALTKAGIKVTEIKSAPLKYVGSPAKDLTPEEEAHLKEKVMESAGIFKKQMYLTRPQIGEGAFTGEVFSASESLSLGLIDGIKTYSSIFEQLSASAGSNNQHSYKEDLSMKRKVTAAMAEAAISAGADPKSLEIVSDEIYAALPEEEKVILADLADGEEASNEETPDLEALTAQVDDLTTQNAALTEELAASMMQVETLTSQVEELTGRVEQSAAEPLRVIAEDRVKLMRVALGMVNIEMSGFSTDSLLAEYNALSTQMKKAYKSGGHTTAKPESTNSTPATSKVTSIEAARVRATGV